MAVDSHNALHLVWEEGPYDNYSIFYAARSSGGSMSPPVNISGSSGDADCSGIAIDRDDNIHVVWNADTDADASGNYDEILYAVKPSGGSWSAPLNISNTPGETVGPSIVVGSDRTVHAVWTDKTLGNSDIFYVSKPSGGTWSAPVNISSDPGASGGPVIAIGDSGALHVVWSSDTNSDGYPDEIFYAVRPPGGSWSAPLNISNTPGLSNSASLAVDRSGALHVVWDDNFGSDIFYVTKPAGGIWSAPVNISNNSGMSARAVIAIDNSGALHVVWEDTNPGNSDIFYVTKPSGGTWSAPLNISNTPGASRHPAITIDNTQALHVAWDDTTPGNWDIFYATAPGSLQSGKIAFTSNRDGNQEIYLMNVDGSNQTRLTSNAAVDTEPAWSPDGTRIAFTSERDGNAEIYVMNADGSNLTRLTNNTARDGSPVWSPDGTRIAFTSMRDGNSEIYVIKADGTNPVRLTNNSALDDEPAWSPDGTRLAFGSNRDGNGEIYVMNADGTNQVRLTNNIPTDGQPAWSPDGTKLAFISDRDGGIVHNWEIYIMKADGTSQVRLTNVPGDDLAPSWSPDGTKIAFTSARDGNYEIYVMNADGSNQTRLTNNTASDSLPAWSLVGVVFPPPPIDATPPASVTNLAVTSVTTNSITLRFTAPGDDGNSGTARTYDIRYSASLITVVNWASATQCTGESAPKIAGSAETFTVTNLSPATTYYFGLKTADEVPNWSGLSNVAVGTTVGIRIIQPNGGETWAVGSTQSIRWSSSGVAGNVTVSLSRDAGTSWQITASGTPNDGSEDWHVIGPPTGQTRIKVTSVLSPSIYDISDANFAIVQRALAEPALDGFDYPVGSVYRPTRDSGDSDGWFVSNRFCEFYAGAPGPFKYHPGDDWNRDDGKDAGEPVKAVANGTVEAFKPLHDKDGRDLGQGIVISHKLQDGSSVFSVYVSRGT